MVMNTAICCGLCGLALCLSFLFSELSYLHIYKIVGTIVLLITTAAFLETLTDIDLHIDYADFHRLLQPNYPHPGRMALNTALGLGLYGFSLVFLSYNLKNKTTSNIKTEYFALTIIGIGLTGLLGYVFNIKSFYSWTSSLQMSLPTAVCIMVLGIGLFKLRTYLEAKSEEKNDSDLNKISSIAALILTIISLFIGATSFLFETRTTFEVVSQKIKQDFHNRRYFIDFDLKAREQRALVAATDNNLQTSIKDIYNSHKAVEAEAYLDSQALKLKSYGFSYVAYLDINGKVLKSSGTTRYETSFKVSITASHPMALMWGSGNYYLYSKIAILDANKNVSGYMLTEQSLPALDEYLKPSVESNTINDNVMCGNAVHTLNCFPTRFIAQPFVTAKIHHKERVPMSVALDNGETSIKTAVDYRDKRVLAAYGPIGRTGLGLVSKVDIADIYFPTMFQLIKSLLVAIIIILIGILMIRKRLLPLVNRIDNAKAAAEIERERFIAATEASLDSFYIFEAVRNDAHQIIDFRCTFVNKRGAELVSTTSEAFTGALVLQYLPFLAGDLYFGTYVKVIETGLPCTDQINLYEDKVEAHWLSRQIVKLGDGVAITVKDITSQKLTELSLLKAKRLQSSIISSASYSIIATDESGIIIAMNKASERMLCYNADDLIGKFTPEIIHDKDEVIIRARELTSELGRPIEPGFEVFVAKAKEHISEEREWTYIRKDGTRFTVNLSVSQLRDEDNNITGYLGVAHDITERKREEDYIKHIALHDVLTGLPNRALFQDRVNVAVENAKRHNTQFAIALLDIDHFKRINDSLGHHIGDILLQEVTQRITNAIRHSDTVARMGGDEFAFLLSDITHPDGTMTIMQNIIKSFKPKVLISNYELHISASIGVCIYPNDGDELGILLRNADTAMYRAKELGRNNFQIFNKEMEDNANKRLSLENQLRLALDYHQFRLFYQPQVDFQTGETVGFEALLRWEKTPGQFVPPLEFIPVAEDSGLIVQIGEWVIMTACQQATKLQKDFGKNFRMAVNVSARQFKQSNFVEFILNALAQHNLSPQLFEIEITESVLMTDIEESIRILRGLRTAGVSIALDDFGTGYSSLSYLNKFQVDRIKIDQSFVKNIMSSQEDSTLANAIITMAKSLKIKAIAEGIETEDQYDFIRSTGCEEAQGYLISRPIPESRIFEYLSQIITQHTSEKSELSFG